ncbi:MAG: serine hydrolase [Ignavibacteriales bacterium]|nr:MAG: serine hydrolase [Ignavibacteriales bacterium]
MSKLFLTLVVLVIVTSLSVPSCTFSKIIWHNFSSIDDYKIFDNAELSPSSKPFHFYESDKSELITELIKNEILKTDIDSLLSSNSTTAFLVIKNDTIIFEKYYNEYNDSSLSLSFSMAKSFLSMLTGCAIDDGYIKSVEQPVTDFVPELTSKGFDKVKIKHLLQMTSGMDYSESDNPFGIHPHFYYGSDLEKKLLSLELATEPGKEFRYKSGEAQLLGLVLSRALKSKSITEYTQQRIWNPLGMEYGGLWSVDDEENKLEKVFCCLSARAKDFAKIGRLYLFNGNWNGTQIVSQSWVEQSTKIDTSEGSAWFYQYMWWLVSADEKDFMAVGHLGQYIFVSPEKNLVIVRLGESEGSLTRKDWTRIFNALKKVI